MIVRLEKGYNEKALNILDGYKGEIMVNEFSRTGLILGEENMGKLANSHVLVFGVGGVGSFVVEGLVRSGIGEITIVDSDKISLTNINRQIHAMHSTIGENKVDIMAKRIKDINPNCKVNIIRKLYTEDTKEEFFSNPHYIVDAIDDVKGKISIILEANKRNIPIISSMGTGNKIDPQKLVITDIHKTHTCPLAKIIRKAARQNKIKKLDVIFSTEEPKTDYVVNFVENSTKENQPASSRKSPLGSTSFVPPVAGLSIASFVIRKICNL